MRRRSGLDGSSDAVVVRFSRKKGLAFGLFFGLVVGPRWGEEAWTGNVGQTVMLGLFVLMALWFLINGIRAKPRLVIDRMGLTICEADVHLTWSEIAAVGMQEWQATYDLAHRLVVRPVHQERFEAMWQDKPRRPWRSRPRDGRFELMLDLLSPSARRIADAIRECSEGKFAPEVRRVGRRPFRDPEMPA